MKTSLLLILIFFVFGAFKPKPSYQIFTGDKEKQIDFDEDLRQVIRVIIARFVGKIFAQGSG